MHYAGLSWVCSVSGGLAALEAEAKGGWPDGAPARIREELAGAFAPKGNWGPDHAISEILDAVPPGVTVTVDTGAHRILLSQMWRAAHARGVLQSTGLCTMGCALPLAMGFKYARPDAPVIAFTGDAGLEMVLGELSTLRDLGLPVVIVVFVDESLALIELKQRAMGDTECGGRFPPHRFRRAGADLWRSRGHGDRAGRGGSGGGRGAGGRALHHRGGRDSPPRL
jgi:acetolactate synthase-1/2/3 large subunit